MRILLVSQYFWPESFIINDLVRTLADQGHTLTILTGKPNYPDGDIFDGYRKGGADTEEFIPGVMIFRAPLRPRGKGSAKSLLLNYLSFVWNGVRYFPRAVEGQKFDVILVFCLSPVTSVIPAIYLKWRLKRHLAVWVQDLWPESLSATGFIRHPMLLRLVGYMVKAIYRCSDTLLIQSRAFYDPVTRYADGEKIVYYPNSHRDIVADRPSSVLDSELAQLLDDSFCVVFAGNLGTAQSVHTIIKAAQKLKHLPTCKLVLIGSGSMLEWLKNEKEAFSLDNVVLPGRYPPSLMPEIFERSAGLLVALKRDAILSCTVPSKLQAYLAAGRPIIASLDGEGARVVKEARAGLTCAAEDANGLVAAIEALYRMLPEEREALGRAGRKYFLENYEMTKNALHLVEVLQERIQLSKRTSL